MKIILIAIFLAITLQSCNHKEQPVKPKPIDTCEGRRNLVPEIIIYEDREGTNSPVFVKDTVLTSNDISFEAPEGFSAYSWKIGDDEREFNVRKISFRFLEPWGFLSLRLIVKYPLECRADTFLHIREIIVIFVTA